MTFQTAVSSVLDREETAVPQLLGDITITLIRITFVAETEIFLLLVIR